jgi:hypothetical protein
VPFLLRVYEENYNVYRLRLRQGEVLNRCGMKMTPDWEKCTSPVLDISGGRCDAHRRLTRRYLAARAAAFEPRIKRVVLYDIIYDFYGSLMAKSSAPMRFL